MGEVIEVSEAELRNERSDILARLGLTLEEARARADAGSLVGVEWELWARLEDIAYLLAGA